MTVTSGCDLRSAQGRKHGPHGSTSRCPHRYNTTESVHLDPKCWEDPTVFNPYRHIDAEGKLVTNQGNFYPVCAGESLAKLIELFLFVSWLIHNFTFIAAEGPTPKVKAVFVQFPLCYKIRAIKRWWSVKYKGLSGMKKIATSCFLVFKKIPSYLRR